MKNIKHVGRIANTGVKCIVVFREIYDERGNVADQDHCLVVETERLPDMEHDDIIRVVESNEAQSAQQFYEIAHRSMFSDGVNMLSKLHNRGYLRKYPTTQVELTPNNSTAIKLSDVNEIIRKQKSGMSESDIQRSMTENTTIETPQGVLSEVDIAKNMLSQADTFIAEAEKLRKEAYEMAPELSPKKSSTAKNSRKKSQSPVAETVSETTANADPQA